MGMDNNFVETIYEGFLEHILKIFFLNAEQKFTDEEGEADRIRRYFLRICSPALARFAYPLVFRLEEILRQEGGEN